MKTCKKCNIEKHLDLFYKAKSNKDGYNKVCADCVKERVNKYRLDNIEAITEKKAQYYKKNTERLNAKSKAWYEKNKDHALQLSKIWQQNNPEKRTEIQKKYYLNGGKEKKLEWHEKNKDQRSLYYKEYRKNNINDIRRNANKYVKANPKKALHRCRLRQMQKLNATPLWADLNEIKEVYKNCPKGMHVDHIIPIKGELVCGLHVINNLQYLTAFDNLSKGNKFTT